MWVFKFPVYLALHSHSSHLNHSISSTGECRKFPLMSCRLLWDNKMNGNRNIYVLVILILHWYHLYTTEKSWYLLEELVNEMWKRTSMQMQIIISTVSVRAHIQVREMNDFVESVEFRKFHCGTIKWMEIEIFMF
jgi:hypothetical protein